jgi:septal ring factor EnvC (AmiA/AmiB activator)
MHDAHQLIGPVGPAPRFAIAFRGYDRSQVDSWLSDHEREMTDVAGPLAETTRRQQALESRLAQLQLEESKASDASEGPSPASLAAFVLRRAQDIARELPDHMAHQAEAERQLAEEATTQVIEAGRARSAQIVGAAQRDRDQVASMVDEAREQIDEFRDQANRMATEQVQRRWQPATLALAELEVELAGLRAQRHAMVSELSQLETALEATTAQLRDSGTAEVEVVAPVASHEPELEHRPGF